MQRPPTHRSAPRAVYFDLDQTLIQHAAEATDLAREALLNCAPHKAADVPAFESALLTEASQLWGRVAEFSGDGAKGLRDAVARALATAGFDVHLAEQLLEALLEEIVKSSQPTANAHATLDALRASGFALGIITNGFTWMQRRKAVGHGLLERVHAFVTSEHAGAHKPDRRIFDFALDALQVTARESWYVGDNFEKDVRGAALAGMTSVLFDPAGRCEHQRHTESEKPDYTISDLRQLLELVPTRVSPGQATHSRQTTRS